MHIIFLDDCNKENLVEISGKFKLKKLRAFLLHIVGNIGVRHSAQLCCMRIRRNNLNECKQMEYFTSTSDVPT